MAIYHFSAKVISRSHGRSAVAAAAYRSGSRFHDQRQDLSFDYAHKTEVVHSEILLPEGAPQWMADRERLWNAVEAGEKRKDAQLAREVEFALPLELSREQGIALARDFVRDAFVAKGIIADLNVHWDSDNPHVHVMLTMREVSEQGFGKKVTEWNKTELLQQWRTCWEEMANERLQQLGHDVRIDHRSYKDQGIELEPTSHLGKAVMEMAARGDDAERKLQLEAVRQRNARTIEQRPELVFETITHQRSTFTRRDIAREVFRYVDDGERFRNLMARLEGSKELVVLVPEVRDGREIMEPARYTTRAMLRVEQRLAENAERMAGARTHAVGVDKAEAILARHSSVTDEQKDAVRHVLGAEQLQVVTGFAGAGKSTAVTAAREAWEAQGYRVFGAALSGIAAENLGRESGVESRTLASWERGWKEGRGEFGARDILVIDEAGMIGSRQLERVLREVRERGAKAVLLGDAEQLQPIEAGAAFRAVAERTGYQELSAIQRQRQDWQRDASREFAHGHSDSALARYEQHHAVHFAARRDAAKVELVHDWAKDRAAEAEGSALILAHTRADVRQLNEMARAVLKRQGELGQDVAVSTSREVIGQDGTVSIERGRRNFAIGDRIMFLKNDRGLEVRNGSLGTVVSVSADSLSVKSDKNHRQVSFNLRDYSAFDHGYASTIHKAQGSTVERGYVLATPGMDRHLAYVAMTRHRESAHIYAGHDDFKDFDRLTERLSRAALKDTTLDYAARRGLERGGRAEAVEQSRQPTRAPEVAQPRGLVAHFKEVQQEFIKASGRADIDPAARQRTDQLRAEMKKTALELGKTREGHKEAEKSGIGGQVRDFVRQAEKEKERDRGLDKERDRDLELER